MKTVVLFQPIHKNLVRENVGMMYFIFKRDVHELSALRNLSSHMPPHPAKVQKLVLRRAVQPE